jgi:ABC-type sulfate transport system permease subunit
LNDEFQGPAAFAVASLLAVLALVTLAFKTFLEWRQHREFELAQQAVVAESGGTKILAFSKSE